MLSQPRTRLWSAQGTFALALEVDMLLSIAIAALHHPSTM